MVALNVPAVKVDFVGTRVGGEEWSTGFWCATAATAPTQADLDAFCTAVNGLWATAWTTLKTRASVGTAWTTTRAYFYPQGQSTAQVASAVVQAGVVGSGGSPHPYQVSVVCSLRTPVPGRRTRGRMYLPLNAVTCDGNSQYDNASLISVADTMDTLLTAVNGLTIGGANDVDVIVASHTSGSASEVTQIIVDSVPDIQRRRANQLAPASTIVRAL